MDDPTGKSQQSDVCETDSSIASYNYITVPDRNLLVWIGLQKK